MEERGTEETSDVGDSSPSSFHDVHSHLEESMKSDDSWLLHNEDSTGPDMYDTWEHDNYYNIPESLDNDSEIENCGVKLDETPDSSFCLFGNSPPVIEEIIDESLEENNNDPNNNMDLIEINGVEEEAGHSGHATTNKSGHREATPPLFGHVVRSESPKPGCSKDSPPMWAKLEKIMSILNRINCDSILNALYKNDGVPVCELKLCDLLPEIERANHLRPFAVMSQKVPTMNNGTKRGSTNDICTIESKKSSSDPDLSIPSPTVSTPSITRVSSTSQLTQLPANPTAHRGAIPKVRDTSSKQQKAVRTPQRGERSLISGQVPIPRLSHKKHKNLGLEPKSSVNHSQLAPAVSSRVLYPAAEQNSSDLSTTASILRALVLKHPIPRPGSKLAELRRTIPVVGIPRPVSNTTNVIILQQASTNQHITKKMEIPTQPPPVPVPVPVQQQITERTVCTEMYDKLTFMFPNIDTRCVKNLCPSQWGPGDRDAQLAPLVEYLLERGDSLPQAPKKETENRVRPGVSYSSVDDIYENLLGIFPDADPHYLHDFAVKNIDNQDALENFVASKLEHRDYPTRDQYMARLKITEQQRQYTTGFDVKQFLSIIPDPSKHFMDPKRKCTHQTVAFEFLKSHFNKTRVTTISNKYVQCNYNLSLTVESLERLDADLKSKRVGNEIPTEDILLLQEIAFIKHKTEIDNYLANVKRTEDEEFRFLKAMNQLFECQCCYDTECLPSKCSQCDSGHVFCNSCIVTGTNAKMAEDETRIYCFINCGREFSLSVLQGVLAPTTFSILVKKRQAAEVIEAGIEGLVSCPFCHFASIPPKEDKIFKCLNPECTKESCRLCKELSHVPLKCDEVMKADNARRFIEEKMTEALARKCYKCQRAFFKEEGCNKITCPCGASMCYLCDEPIKDYSHFRGQGSNDRNLCPLYSDTIRLDAVAVRAVGEQAELEFRKRNPNINIDTTGLLPDIPHPSVGAHTTVLNADELPVMRYTD